MYSILLVITRLSLRPMQGVSSIALACLCSFGMANRIEAQVDEGDILVLTFDFVGGVALWLHDTPTGATTPVAGLPVGIAGRARGLEIDPVTGDAFLFSKSATGTTGSEVWLLRLNGTVATASLVHTFPAGFEIVDTDRARSGCMIAMLEDPDNPSGDYALFERLLYANGSLVVQNLPLTGVQAEDRLLSIAYDNREWVLVGFETGTPIAQPGAYQAKATGALTLVAPAPPLRPFALEAELPPTASQLVGGNETAFGAMTKNFGCAYFPITLPPVGASSNTVVIVRDIYFEDELDRILVGVEDPSIAVGSGGALLALDNIQCSFPDQSVLATFVDTVRKVASRTSEKGYGCGCLHSDTGVARMGETSPPTPGTTWDLTLEFGVENSLAFVVASDTVALFSFGSLDCFGLIDPTAGLDFSALVTTDGAGAASIQVPVPAAASISQLFGQWVVLDPAQGGVILSAGIRSTP